MALVFPSSPTPGQTYVGPNNITYTWDNTLGVWTGSSPAAGGLTAASLAQAAAGTLNTVASTPQTAVPKDASGMTGAALIPAGTDAQRAAIATPTVGMQRYNTNDSFEEIYTGATLGWKKLQWVVTPNPLPADLTISASTTLTGPIVCNNLTIAAGITINIVGSVLITCYGDALVNACTILGDASGSTGGGYWGINSTTNVGGLTGAGPGGGSGNNGGTPCAGGFNPGSGGSGGFSIDPGTILSRGGNGGAAFGIRAVGDITFNGGVNVSVNGEAGATNLNSSGGGGGSGGTIAYVAQGALAMSGTHSAQGGSGGNGNGGAVGTSGGGGGGGGAIYLFGAKGVTGGYTAVVTQGPAGSWGAPAILGGGGGGGNGGAGGSSAANFNQAGGIGVVLLAPPAGL